MRLYDRICLEFASLGPVGKFPFISGTWGSAAAALLAPWLFMPLSFPARVLVLAVLFILGGEAGTNVEKRLGRKDPGVVVIDELIGQWTTYLFFPVLGPWQLFLGFVLFRIFDILKPCPVRASENWLPGGYGIMIDDVLAGLYAYVCLGFWLLFTHGPA